MNGSLQKFLDAGFPLLFVATYDESRLVAELQQSGRRLFTYSASSQLVDVEAGSAEPMPAAAAFAAVAAIENAVLVVRDMQHIIRNAPIYRAVLDCCDALKMNGSAVVAVAPSWQLPAELQHSAPIIQQRLPNRDELAAPLSSIMAAASIESVDDERRAALLDAAAGLTLPEAENAFALSLVESAELSPAIVQREKMRLIAATGFLTVEQPLSVDAIGGLGELKRYLTDEVVPSMRDDQLRCRGFLLAGLPGGGKSISAKATAAILGRPLVRLDVGACKGSLVGQSEGNIRQATALVEAIAPAVLWIDELEKAIGGATGSGAVSDGGTSLGMLGHLLTWLQEHKAPVVTVATCNDYSALPPELTRAGRFDERFVVDLPTTAEREAIAAVHLTRFGCALKFAEPIAKRTAEHTGAEIEQLVKSAARLSGRQLTTQVIDAAAASIKPIAAIDKERVTKFRQWSKKVMRVANTPEAKPANNGRRATLAELN